MFIAACRKLSSKFTEDNSVTSGDVNASIASSMSNAGSSSVKRTTSAQRTKLIDRSTTNAAAGSQVEVRSRRPAGSTRIDARTRSASCGRQSADELSNRRAAMTSRDVSNTTATTPARRAATPTSLSATATSLRQNPVTNSPKHSLTTSKQLCRSVGNLTTMSVMSPPPRRRMSSNIAAATASSPSVGTRQQPRPTDSKPVVISGRGYRAQAPPAAAAAATATASTRDAGGGGKNASMRSRVGIAPKLLLPSCYQPGKTTPAGTPARSFSVDESFTTSSPPVAADSPVVAATTSPKIQRSVSVEEKHTLPSPQAKNTFDSYPEPPEDLELNARMEMLFEEYRKVERGLIFANEHSSCPDNSAAKNSSSTSTSPSSKPSARRTATAGSGRISQTRAKSIGDLSMGSTKHTTSTTTCVSFQQDRTVPVVSSSSMSGTSTWTSRGVTAGRSSIPLQRGQSSPGVGRRSAPSSAKPSLPPANAVSSGVTASRPRQSPQSSRVSVVPQPAANLTDVVRATPANRPRSQAVTRVRRDSLPTSLQDTALRLRTISAAVDNVSARVDSNTPPKRRSSTPNCSVASDQRAAIRRAELMRTNSRIGRCNAVAERSRQSEAVASDSNSMISTQSASDDQTVTIRQYVDRPAVKGAKQSSSVTERPSRASTVGGRSLIPRPVSCSGWRAPSRRREQRDTAPKTTKPERSEPTLRRFDSGVDVAAAGLSPTDDEGGGSFEAVVERLSASLESCTMALPDNDKCTRKSSAWPDSSTALTAVDSVDEDYY